MVRTELHVQRGGVEKRLLAAPLSPMRVLLNFDACLLINSRMSVSVHHPLVSGKPCAMLSRRDPSYVEKLPFQVDIAKEECHSCEARGRIVWRALGCGDGGFYEGVLSKGRIIFLDLLNTYMKTGVQRQIFTIINDKDYYCSGSTTGTSHSNTICYKYTLSPWCCRRSPLTQMFTPVYP